MNNKNLLLWVVALIALVLSVVAIISPRGKQSDAAYSSLTPSLQQNVSTITQMRIDDRDVTEGEYNICRIKGTLVEFDNCVRAKR